MITDFFTFFKFSALCVLTETKLVGTHAKEEQHDESNLLLYSFFISFFFFCCHSQFLKNFPTYVHSWLPIIDLSICVKRCVCIENFAKDKKFTKKNQMNDLLSWIFQVTHITHKTSKSSLSPPIVILLDFCRVL